MGKIIIQNLEFKKINQQQLNKINISELKYFFLSQSGAIDAPGNLYLFTSNGAFFINHVEKFIDKFLLKIKDWYKWFIIKHKSKKLDLGL